MLTPDLVHARRQKDELKLIGLGTRREEALQLAEAIVDLATQHVGRSREELEAAWNALETEPRDRKLLDGLCKLVDDGLSFESEAGEHDPIELRSELFQAATKARRELGEAFSRDAVIAAIAESRGLAPDAFERALYADLKGAQVLREPSTANARALIEGYDVAQAQAVLLRATRVVARIERVDPAALRTLFRKLKFLRLLYSVRREDNAYVLELDGPFSLFESVTKYGLALAIALPAITSCGKHRIVADVRWGKERLPLRFVIEGESRGADDVPVRLPDEAEALRVRLADRDGDWEVRVAETILELPGAGTCVPDLTLVHRKTKRRAHVEVMGYWSRDAVWARVELARAGLPEPVIFCVSERLRVSEAVLPDDAPAALLVYKGVIPIAALEERLAKLAR